jgi:hypothetical protein
MKPRDALRDQQPDTRMAGLRAGHQPHRRAGIAVFESRPGVADHERDHVVGSALDAHVHAAVVATGFERVAQDLGDRQA